MRPFRQRAIDRRTFLRGGAACLALPWLEAMQPALARPRGPLPRCVFVFSPNGVNVEQWQVEQWQVEQGQPGGEGASAPFQGTLAPLAAVRDRVTAFSGLAIDAGKAHGDGTGDHARSGATFLTCVHPRKTGGADLRAGVSVDQHIAAQIGADSTFASLELGMERGAAAGICDSGYSCAYTNHISWRAADMPVAKEVDPRAVFTRLFGDPQQAVDQEAMREARRQQQSVLDLVLADSKSLAGKLGAADRQKLDQYLQSVRELEQRLLRPEPERPQTPVPDGLLAGSKAYPERLALMYELLTLALATERTRVATFMLGNAGSNRSYEFLGVPEGHHDLSHHGKQADKMAAIAKINRFQVEQFAKFVARLKAERDGERDLLSQCFVVFGSGIGDGNRHNHDDLPVLLAGEGGRRSRLPAHVVTASQTPLANLYLALLRTVGVDAAAFADSTQALELG